MFWNNLGLTKKIAVFITAMLLILAVLAGFFILTINSLTEASRRVSDATDFSESMLAREVSHLKWINALQSYVLNSDPEPLKVQMDPRKCGLGSWYYGEGRRNFVAVFPYIAEELDRLEAPHSALHKSAEDIKRLIEAGNRDEAEKVFHSVSVPSVKAVRRTLRNVTRAMGTEKAASIARFESAARTSQIAAFSITGLGLVVSVLLGLLLARTVTAPMVAIAAYAGRLAGGDLDARISMSRSDELGSLASSLQRMVGSIRGMIGTADLKTRQAEESSRAKGDFLSNMSHEMRTPLNAIIGMTSIGKSASDVEKKDYAFGKIQDASTHLLGVVNDVLDMSKIEANKLELSILDFDFERMLRRVVNFINFRVDEKHQNFHVTIDKAIPRKLSGDDQRLAQVIANLLSNAVKFTPENGSIRLDTRLEDEKDGLCAIRIEVADTGIGISREQQERLFNSFQQADSSTSRDFGGTGLGLAISKRILALMGGHIWVESEHGQGSTFIFTVRLPKARTDKQSLLNEGVRWKNIRILAVDDDPEVLAYFTDIAQGLGIICDTAAGGTEAVVMLERGIFHDIYFIDWKMPGMNGIDLSRKIKKRRTDNSVVTMISSTGWSTIADDAKAAGVDRFLPKPLFASDIADCINNCLGGGGMPVEEPADGMGNAFAGRRVLLADDVEINREIVLALLEPSGLEIDCAENGEEALRMFSEKPDRYDLILMDVQMPGMDGLEATRRIRALGAPRGRDIPIIAMTANVFREDVEKCLAAGMNDHLGKPLEMEVVFARLRAFFYGS